MNLIDLHVHSNRSDGTMAPAALVALAADRGLRAFALTDHDSTDGLAEALEAGARLEIEVVPGIELSTEYQGGDVHILGLEFAWKDPAFQDEIRACRQERLTRNRRMIDRMAADGIDISFEQMERTFGNAVWTRAHFARYLADHGYASDMREAFRTFVGEGCRYFIPRRKITPADAVRLIRRYGGIPILAHPYQYRLTEEGLQRLIECLSDAGLAGMETWYSLYDSRQTAALIALAGRYGLTPSGGSDFHGSNKPDIMLGSGKNNLQIPYSVLEHLRERREWP